MARASLRGFGGAQFGGDFGSMFKSTRYGTDITAPVWAIDLALPPGDAPNISTSGCEAEDHAGDPDGAIIIVQRGTCTFAQNFTLADASPAGAMVFINEGQPGRTVPLWFNFDGLEIPTVAATVETGTALSNGVHSGDTGLTVRFKIDWRPGRHPGRRAVHGRRGDQDAGAGGPSSLGGRQPLQREILGIVSIPPVAVRVEGERHRKTPASHRAKASMT